MTPSKKDSRDSLSGAEMVLLNHDKRLGKIRQEKAADKENAESSIRQSEQVLSSLGIPVPDRDVAPKPRKKNLPAKRHLKDWAELVKEAEAAYSGGNVLDILSPDEVQFVLDRHASLGKDLGWFRSLDRYDYALSVAAGVIAGLLDIFMVRIPHMPEGARLPGLSKQGWLSDLVEKSFGRILPPEKINILEAAYKVPYDAATSKGLKIPIPGLYPKTHRWHSLGHDPVLGFFFGVSDILKGNLTTIGSDGVLIIQKTAGPFMDGQNLFVRLFGAIQQQAGHLLSDVNTAQGVPPPLMPLLQLCKFGKIGPGEHTVGDFARYMYRTGYDFRHFIACSLPVMAIEVIVRVGYMARALYQGKKITEAIPSASSVKLRRQLLIAHGVATLMNAGKVYVTQNVWGISMPQVLALLRYLAPEMMYLLHGREFARRKIVQTEIMAGYKAINADLDRIAQKFSGPQLVI